jgi:flagellar assembly factor FliW
MKVNALDVGVSSIDTAACPTVIAEVVDSDPEVAVIVAVPFATEVTIPTESTVATAVSDEDSVTVSPVITVPPPSLTVAVNVTVSPKDVNVWVVGVSSIDVAA